MAPKVALLNRRSSQRARNRRRPSRSETSREESVEVSVPALDENAAGYGSDHSTLPRHSRRLWLKILLLLSTVFEFRSISCKNPRLTNSLLSSCQHLGHNRVLISSTGQCTPVEDEGSANQHRGGPPHDRPLHGRTLQGRRMSSGRLALGRFKGTLEDKMLDGYLWLQNQGKSKHINAEKDITNIFHDSFLYGEVPLSIKVRAAIRGWPLNFILLWLEFLAAVTSVSLYILSTYTVDSYAEKPWIRLVELVCGLFFVVDYIIKLYSAPVRLYYMFSATGIIDFISTVPIALYWGDKKGSYAGAEILLFFRALRLMPMITSVGGLTGGIKEQIFILVMYILGVVFIAGGLLQWVEFRATPPSVREALNCNPQGCISFYEALYFMVVTVSTVGYGDITLKSNWGRFVAVCTIIAALVVLPVQINRILQLASRRPYGGNFAVKKVVGSRFIIVSGNLSYRTIQDFLAEFYHPNHDKDLPAFPLRVVIMAPFRPSFELRSLFIHYKGRVEFIEGTPVKDTDLDRVSAKVASAFYLLADQQAKDPDAEDAAQIMRALSVHRHCGSQVRVIVELLKPEKQVNAIWDDTKDGIEIICPDAIRFKLLARSCHIKGLSTFLINLFRSGLTVTKPKPNHWMVQYLHGLRQEVFPAIFPGCFHREGLKFEQVAELVYCRYGVILFGLDIATMNNDADVGREVLLYPNGRRIRKTDVGLVIAKNLETAELVSKFGRSHHPPCQGYQKYYCPPCLHTRLFPKMKSQEVDDTLLQEMKLASGAIPGDEEASMSMTSSDLEMRVVRESLAQGPSNFDGRGQVQNQQLQELIRVSSMENLSLSRDASIEGSMDSSLPTIQNLHSLEEAVDMAMRWPPLVKNVKPEQPILERRTRRILENLKERTLYVVKRQSSHVLLCIQGKWPVSLFYFVAQLRTDVVPHSPIVILHPHEPDAADWGCVGLFEDVYFVKGSPVYELDLLRAGVMQAEKVVILTQGVTAEERLGSSDQPDRLTPSHTFTLDVNNVIIAATVERLLVPQARVMVELQQEIEIQYLRPKLQFDRRRFDNGMYQRNQAATFQFAPPYIEGKGFCPAALGFLMYATFYNRHTVRIVEQLISGCNVPDEGDQSNKYGQEKMMVRKLEQIAVPTKYVGKRFEEMFIGMVKEGGVALGLYRAMGTNGSVVAFVYTNPIPSTELLQDDLVYILH